MPSLDKEIQTLARAFFLDPLFDWVLPRVDRRAVHLRAIFSSAAHHCARVGGLETSAHGQAVAIWSPGRKMRIGLVDALRVGALMLPVQIGLGNMNRLDRTEAEAEAFLHDAVPGPFAYLMAVAVDPARQGQGLGRRAIAAVEAAACRAGHRTLALKTENPGNVPLYERLGFRVQAHATARCSGITTWAMAKEVA